jgi:hypothetical protein
MFLVGVLGRHLFRLYLKHGNSVLYSVMYSLLVTRMGIFLLNNDLGTAVLKSGIDVVPIIFLLWISQRRIMLPPRPAVGVAP